MYCSFNDFRSDFFKFNFGNFYVIFSEVMAAARKGKLSEEKRKIIDEELKTHQRYLDYKTQ